MNPIKICATPRTLRTLIVGLKNNKIDITAVNGYNLQKLMLPGRIELVEYKVRQNDKNGLINCLKDAEQMLHLFDQN